MKALILCGGLGTRLRSVIGATQKAVADIDGQPFINLVAEELAAAGINDLVFCTYYQSDQIEKAVAALSPNHLRRTCLVLESTPLGTGGAIVHAISQLAYIGPFIALNADTYLDASAYRAAAAAPSPVLLVTPMPDCTRYGAVVVDKNNRVLKVTEKGIAGPGLISAGVYGLHTSLLREFPVGPLSMEQDIVPTLIAQEKLTATLYSGPFLDIGTPESLSYIREHGVQKL